MAKSVSLETAWDDSRPALDAAKPKNDPGHYVLNESEIDRYIRSGSVGVDWSPMEDGEIDYSRDWKAI
jgi:hypothetical protein